jgi:acetyl esterase/lipase
MKRLALVLACLVATPFMPSRAAPPVIDTGSLMGPQQFQKIPSKPADARIRYGSAPDQFADLRVPPGKGPHPLVILIHGGCWKAAYSTLKDLAPVADALKKEGIATWNVEYRRIGQPGGGYPGTYLDIGKGVDKVRDVAGKYRLDLSRVVLLGHSAGGHLAMWAAARPRLRPPSPLFMRHPLRFRRVFDLAGGPDMAAYLPVEQQACSAPVVEEMMGGGPAKYPSRFRDVSAARLLPLGVRQTIVWGERDNVVPIALGRTYLAKAKRAGDPIDFLAFPKAGHFEIASPRSPTWPQLNARIVKALAAPSAN